VAVNVVWLVSRTTVKGTPAALVPTPPRRIAAPTPLPVEEPVDVAQPAPATRQSRGAAPSPTA
jgi:hypothetical protein